MKQSFGYHNFLTDKQLRLLHCFWAAGQTQPPGVGLWRFSVPSLRQPDHRPAHQAGRAPVAARPVPCVKISLHSHARYLVG
jgi:hypothetical protein